MSSKDHVNGNSALPDGFLASKTEKLTGSTPEKGGLLFLPKKPTDERHVFKTPSSRVSALGLDVLAGQKREEKRVREESQELGTGYVLTAKTLKCIGSQKETYRKKRIETPSDVGGLSFEAKERLGAHKKERGKFKGESKTMNNAKVKEGGLILNSKSESQKQGRMRSEWDQTPKRFSNSLNGSATPRLTSSTRSVSEWDQATPRVDSTGYDDEYDEANEEGWKEEQIRLDRDWYNLEEGGAMDDAHNEFTEHEGYYRKKEEEFVIVQKKKVSARQAQV